MSKKLFEVKVELTTYVWAEDEVEATELGEKAIGEEAQELSESEFEIEEVTNSRWPLAPGWGPNALVWGADRALSLGEALKRLR